MKYYIAAKFEDIYRVNVVKNFLENLGHTITHDWAAVELPKDISKKFLQVSAVHDFKGVVDADAVIFLFLEELEYCGALVEFGMALALQKKVTIIGHACDKCIFMNLPTITQFDTVGEWMVV